MCMLSAEQNRLTISLRLCYFKTLRLCYYLSGFPVIRGKLKWPHCPTKIISPNIYYGILKCQSVNLSLVKWSESEVAQSCPTLCEPMDCSLPGSSIHGIFQTRIPEWVAISFSRRSSQPRDWTRVSHIVGRCFTIWATRKVTLNKRGPNLTENNLLPLTLYVKGGKRMEWDFC